MFIVILRYINIMGVTKTENFSESHNRIAQMAKVIGHPARVAILDYLASSKQCICGDLVNELPLAQATISQHLKELKNAGLIKGNIDKTSVCYCIDEETWTATKELFNAWFDKVLTEGCC